MHFKRSAYCINISYLCFIETVCAIARYNHLFCMIFFIFLAIFWKLENNEEKIDHKINQYSFLNEKNRYTEK